MSPDINYRHKQLNVKEKIIYIYIKRERQRENNYDDFYNLNIFLNHEYKIIKLTYSI